jgi:hypothetical protein
MKKVLILMFAILGMMATSTSVQAKEIVSLEACGRGMFGYSYTNWTTVSYVDANGKTRSGWKGICHGRGFSGCNPPGQNAPVLNDHILWDEADQYDLNITNSKIEEIEGFIFDGSQTSGSITLTYHVVGQNFNRHYTFIWSSEVDEEGEVCSSIKVDMDYVQL